MKISTKNLFVVVSGAVRHANCAFVCVVTCVWSGLVMAIPVNVNQADAETIADALAGIGQKTAIKIVEYRKANGPFKAIEDLTNIKGIGEKKLAKIKQDVQLK